MGEGNLGPQDQQGGPALPDQTDAQVAMAPYGGVLILVERPGFEENGIRDADLAYVVQHGRHPKFVIAPGIQPGAGGQGGAVTTHSFDVAAGLLAAESQGG